MKKSVCLLGSTGSVGVQALEVFKKLDVKVVGIAANKNIELLEKQAREFDVELIYVHDEKLYRTLKDNLKDTHCEVISSREGLFRICSCDCDIVLNAIVGVAGLLPTVFALESGKDVALANKETLVTGGRIVMDLAKKNGCKILPVDSEHSAILQCVGGNLEGEVEKIILTASGGPFFGKTREFLRNVRVEDALKHPNWSMGKKITIDSATMMNKGLEIIEAMHLFNKSFEEVEVVVNPQSVLHSAVEFVDGSILGQFSEPDMKLAIQYAITYPKRSFCDIKKFSFTDYEKISFYKPDYETFRCLKLCEKAIEKKGLYPTILNAANEKAVELFLKGQISFLDIEKSIEKALDDVNINESLTINSILKTDYFIKEFVSNFLKDKVI